MPLDQGGDTLLRGPDGTTIGNIGDRLKLNAHIADPISGVRVKVNPSGEIETTASVGSISFDNLLSQDLFADTWFEVLTFGLATDVVRIQIPDNSIDISITLTGATDILTARDRIITVLQADSSFNVLYEAVKVLDNAIIHISSLKLSEAGEHLDIADFII